MRSISSREFNQDASKAKRATEKGLVFITDRGTPTHVLLTIEDYYKLTGNSQSVADSLSVPRMTDGEAEIEFDPVRPAQVAQREIDLS